MITYNIDKYVYVVSEYKLDGIGSNEVLCVTEDFEHAEKYLEEQFDATYLGEIDGALHYDNKKLGRFFSIQFEFIFDEVED